MAEEIVRLTRRVSDIGLKIGLSVHLKTRPQWFKGTRRVSSLSVGFLLKNADNRSENGGKSVSDPSWDSCTRVKSTYFDQDTEQPKKRRAKSELKLMSQVQYVTTLFTRANPRHNLLFIRAYSGNGGYEGPLYKNKIAYYDILGITQSATQAQVKTAYYKQSFAYHPDRNAGSDEATQRFSEINEAYTVLGNKTLRKRYDRGLLTASDLTGVWGKPSAKDTSSAGSTKRETRTRRSVMDQEDTARIFDFDKFFKAHYGEQLEREKGLRQRREEILKKKQQSLGEEKLDRSLELGVALMLLMTVGILWSLKRG